MSDVETLRKAATLIRERAQAANTDEARTPYGDTRIGVVPPERWGAMVDDYLGGEVGAHCASWHPAVALAVADWLDAAAEDEEMFRRLRYSTVGHLGENPALAVARAYLGSTS